MTFVLDEEELGRRLGAGLERFLGTIQNDSTLYLVKQEMNATIRRMTEEGKIPPDYLIHAVWSGKNDPRKVVFAVARNYPKYPATEAEFEEIMGYAPRQDDLHRLNCTEVGKVGHWQCGWCLKHQGPNFACGCLYIARGKL